MNVDLLLQTSIERIHINYFKLTCINAGISCLCRSGILRQGNLITTRNILEMKLTFTLVHYRILQFIRFTGTLLIMQQFETDSIPTRSEHRTVRPKTLEDQHTIQLFDRECSQSQGSYT